MFITFHRALLQEALTGVKAINKNVALQFLPCLAGLTLTLPLKKAISLSFPLAHSLFFWVPF